MTSLLEIWGKKMGKILPIAVILLFIGVAFAPTFSSAVTPSTAITYDGSLSGYVKNINMNPIEGALVRVYFHGTYEENYSDSNGYYHVTNIPICWCCKNCTASKEGYETEWVWLSIYENTTYNFVLTPLSQYDGSLSGYVNDTYMNPIGEALVRVYFYGTYREDYSDSTGYYYVTDIPICYCLKNATASKEGYGTEWVLLGITENTTYDFVLTPFDSVPDLDCEGGLFWSGGDLEPGDVLTGCFTVGNIGEPNSELDWRIMSCPFWGTWTFDPESGTGLTPEDGFVTVDVELILAVEINETLWGEIGIQNVENESDICYIDMQIKKKSSEEDCGCENEITLDGDFTVICNLLFPVFILSWILVDTVGIGVFFIIMETIGGKLDCWWKPTYP